MSDPCMIFDDPRPIDAVWFPGEDAGGWSVSIKGYSCTKIVAYRENGQGAHVPFVAIYSGEEIVARIPAHLVSIHYAEQVQG